MLGAISRRTAALAIAGLLLTLSGCGSSSKSSTSASTTTTSTTTPSATVNAGPAGGLSVTAVERALLAHGGPPAPTRATCHIASSAERAAAPFGRTKLPVFICDLTLRGTSGTYAVQVLRNNCFVAERRGGGQAVYGCGIVRS